MKIPCKILHYSFYPALLCFLFHVNGYAMDVYRSIDNDGNTRFDHLPPEKKTYDVLTHKPSILNSDENDANPPPQSSEESHASETQKNYHSKLEKLDASRRKACQQAKENRHTLLNNIRVFIKLDDGSKKELTRSEKLEKLQAMDEAITNLCTSEEQSSN